MENLPIELKINVIKELSICDKLNLRLMNKKWKLIIDKYFGIENLDIGPSETFLNCFFGENEQVYCFFINEAKILELQFSQCFFMNIKRLLINNLRRFKFTAISRQLHNFEKLVNLDISYIFKDKDIFEEDSLSIFSPNLKFLRIHRISFVLNITFDTPNLKKVKIDFQDEYYKIIFVHADSIQYLEIMDLNENILDNCVNLEYLHCETTSHKAFDCDKVLKLTKLKEFYLLNDQELMEHLIEKLDQQDRNDLKLFYKYVHVKNLKYFKNLISEYFYFHPVLLKNEFKFLVANQYNLAEKFYFHDSLYYKYFHPYSENVPDDFLNKFSEIEFLHIKKVTNPKVLTNLISKCKKLDVIDFQSPLLKQDFFDNLPYVCAKLRCLRFNSFAKNEKINFNFLTDFKILYIFESFEILPKDLISLLFSQKKLALIECRIEGFDDRWYIDFRKSSFCTYGMKLFYNWDEFWCKINETD